MPLNDLKLSCLYGCNWIFKVGSRHLLGQLSLSSKWKRFWLNLHKPFHFLIKKPAFNWSTLSLGSDKFAQFCQLNKWRTHKFFFTWDYIATNYKVTFFAEVCKTLMWQKVENNNCGFSSHLIWIACQSFGRYTNEKIYIYLL